jgi:hypothetical protein
VEDLLKKISEYQIFNYLLSGSVLVVLLSKTTSISLLSESAIATIFIFYFVGLVVSRIGSILVEPILKKFKVVNFAPYPDYLSAVKSDPKIDTLSQENNTYRTLIATFLVFVIIYALSENAASIYVGKSKLITYLLALSLLLLFVFAYRKQTTYITKRIDKTKGK